MQNKMSKLKRYTPGSERELHIIIKAELDAIEEGLELLQHEYPSGKGIIDFLCKDSGGRLVIIEVKLHEDENILFQALRYYGDIDRDRYVLANLFKTKKVDPEQSPRLILIAERISEDIRRLSTLVVPEVELLEYTAVILPDGEKSVLYHTVSLPVAIKPPYEPQSIDELIEYLTDNSLKPILDKMREAIKGLGKGFQEYATQSYIGYKLSNGRQFAYIRIFRKEIELGAHIVDENKQLLDYEGIRVKKETKITQRSLKKSSDHSRISTVLCMKEPPANPRLHLTALPSFTRLAAADS
jgi:hypothetical protein